jgi:hypothetical protein
MNVAVHKNDFSTDIIPDAQSVRPSWGGELVIVDAEGDDLRYERCDVAYIEIRP